MSFNKNNIPPCRVTAFIVTYCDGRAVGHSISTYCRISHILCCFDNKWSVTTQSTVCLRSRGYGVSGLRNMRRRRPLGPSSFRVRHGLSLDRREVTPIRRRGRNLAVALRYAFCTVLFVQSTGNLGATHFSRHGCLTNNSYAS